MSDYPKTTEVTEIVEREIEAATGDFHSHANKATLDRLTPELMQELSEIADVELETYGFDLESEMVDVDSLFDEEKPENETKKDKFITVTCPHCGHDNDLPM